MFKRTLSESVFVVSDTQTVELHFAKQDKYFISEGINPLKINWHSHITATQQIITLPKKSVRPFFGITNSAGEKQIVAERKLIVPGLDNFRDLGGIKTTENRYVCWNLFFRSDALHRIKNSDFTFLDYLQIQHVFDLRSDAEIAAAKDNLPDNIAYTHFPIFDEKSSCLLQGIQEKYRQGQLDELAANELLLQTYASFVTLDSAKFNWLLHQIFNSNKKANLFHCTAGKDRTGFTAAMILAILKVDIQDILDEYEMTNFYTQKQIQLAMNQGFNINGVNWNISAKVIETLLSVNKKYLSHAFELINSNYGGIDLYIKKQLGFSDSDRKSLINKYTYKI